MNCYKYKYQGQERQEELGLNWDSFKWRNYDPAIGRFFNVDPITEKYVDWAPYVFSGNRVVDSRELEGLEPEHFLSRFNKPKDLSIKIPSANAPLQQYYTVIKDSKVSFNDFKEKFNKSPQDILSNSKATFNSPVNGNDENATFKAGNYMKIDIHGPVDLPSYVKVVEKQENENHAMAKFQTMEGHLEKGIIRFDLKQNKDGSITFAITSQSEVDMGILKSNLGPFSEKNARAQQIASWQEVLDNVNQYLQGTEKERGVEY
ncbi:DUF1990 family protein [Empedobacter falsenii]